MFRAIVFSAVLAGLIGGIVTTAMQAVRVTPLIHQAETYEAAGHDHGHGQSPESSWMPDGFIQTTLATAGANVLAGIGFALLIVAAMSLQGRTGWYVGLLWGLGGFAAFSLAPAAGLPPELPGMASAALFDRQVWWIGTALATAGGLALIILVRRSAPAALGAVLIVAPHFVGAPVATGPGAALPNDLIIEFGIAVLVTNLIFWATLGIAAGILYERLKAP